MSSNKNPASAVYNSSFELVKKQVGTRRDAFDFQLRPVGHTHNYGPMFFSLRFKDIVSNHEHRQGNIQMLFTKELRGLFFRDFLRPLSDSNGMFSSSFLKIFSAEV